MLRLLRFLLLALVLLLVFFTSALVAMRFAIHGREVRVPKLAGLTAAEAERMANDAGLVLSVESRFYTSQIPQGRIVSQSPAPDTRVRHGWKIMVAESLGPQRSAIPNLIGQSEHAADINISRRGLEIGSVAVLHLSGARPETVIAQSPSSTTKDPASPKINLILSAPDNGQSYVMPSFTGKMLIDATRTLEGAGFTLGKVWPVEANSADGTSLPPGTIIRQYPAAGQRIEAGSAINFEVAR